MSKSQQISSGAAATVAAVDNYVALVVSIGALVPLATEATVKAKWYESGTLSFLTVNITTSTTGATCTVTILKNSDVAGNQTLSIGAAATGTFVDSTHTDAVVTGDLWYLKFGSVATGSATITTVTIVFDAAISTSTVLGGFLPSGSSFTPTVGSIIAVSTTVINSAVVASEANVQSKVKTAATFKNMYVYVVTNTKATDTTVGSRLNGAAGTLTTNCTALTTGIFEDSTHSDTLASGDLINWFVTG